MTRFTVRLSLSTHRLGASNITLVKGPVLDVDYALLWHRGTKAIQVVNKIQADPRVHYLLWVRFWLPAPEICIANP